MSKAEFFAHLKAEFFPRLRVLGFSGSGQHFCRVRGVVMQAINLQSSREGDRCAVNLGLHLTFLTDATGGLPEPDSIKEIDCEFRRRLTSRSKPDQWWSYDDLAAPAALIATYFSDGEPRFERFSSAAAIAAEFDAGRLRAGMLPTAFASLTRPRAALAGARIHAHLGNVMESRRIAQWGLTVLGPASALKDELEQLARQ